jgi:uncharacterized protein (DUF302 family)
MYYVVESNKSFEQASTDLEAAVKRNEFGVLHIHDLGNTLCAIPDKPPRCSPPICA